MPRAEPQYRGKVGRGVAKAVVNRFALRTQLSMNLLTHFDELKNVCEATNDVFHGRLLRNAEISIYEYIVCLILCVYVGNCMCVRGLSWAFAIRPTLPVKLARR